MWVNRDWVRVCVTGVLVAFVGGGGCFVLFFLQENKQTLKMAPKMRYWGKSPIPESGSFDL